MEEKPFCGRPYLEGNFFIILHAVHYALLIAKQKEQARKFLEEALSLEQPTREAALTLAENYVIIV